MSDALDTHDPTRGLRTCACCGLTQQVPAVPRGMRACCARCHSALPTRRGARRSNSRTAAVALAALILYPFAVTMPLLRVQQFGHVRESSILDGVASLLGSGEVLVGAVVLVCSVILPLGKLLALLMLAGGGVRLRGAHRALTYRLIEFTGRWGMLDVLAVAVLVASIKLGDRLAVHPGPAALAFAAVVLLSLLAAAVFDPHSLWEADT